jgi:hypothetical protein
LSIVKVCKVECIHFEEWGKLSKYFSNRNLSFFGS